MKVNKLCKNGIEYGECEETSVDSYNGYCDNCLERSYDLATESREFVPVEND